MRILRPSISLSVVMFALVLTFSCCEDSEDPASYPNLSIQFDHYFNNNVFELNKQYVTANQDTVEILEHKYIVSNIVFINSTQGIERSLKNAYYLVKVSLDSHRYQLSIPGSSTGLPPGNWDKIRFLIGLDSATNFAPEAAPKLFTDEGMFWDWNTGYKFYVMEGRYFSKDLQFPSTGVIAHIGDMHNLVELEFDLSQKGNLLLENGKTSELVLNVHVDQLFVDPNLVNLSDSSFQQAMGGPAAVSYRQNYSNGYWVLNSISNP